MLSFVICSPTQPRLQRIVSHVQQTFAGHPFEIVIVTDALSLCEGYNRGLDKCQGEFVVFCHDDIEFLTPDFPARLLAHLQNFDLVGAAGATRISGPGWSDAGPPWTCGQVTHLLENGNYLVAVFGATARIVQQIQSFDGLFMAFRTEVIRKIRWDQETFTAFHGYDVDCSLRTFLAGYRTAVALDLPILHLSHGSRDAAWQNAANAFVRKHQAHLQPVSPRICNCTTIQVPTKQDAAAVMRSIWESLP